jgi:hypothetical protein
LYTIAWKDIARQLFNPQQQFISALISDSGSQSLTS